MRAMPKTLDIQGFSGLREEVVRPQGRPPRTAVLEALILHGFQTKNVKTPENFDFPEFFYINHFGALSRFFDRFCRVLTTIFVVKNGATGLFVTSSWLKNGATFTLSVS